jgi:hypothetical protein
MYKCFKCDKEFKYESKLLEHKNRKKPCDQAKPDLECNICNLNFNCNAEKMRHEKTKKHIIKIKNLNINGDHNNTHIGDINNILNLTLNVNSFKNTDTTRMRKSIIDDIGYNMYNEIMNKKYITDIDRTKMMFNIVLEILEKLHFSLDLEENHNLKILLIFPGIKKTVYEYLILEINPETKEIVWNSLKYEEMIKQILEHLFNINNKINNEDYDKLILFLKRYLVSNEETSIELKPYIEQKLGELYINFNNKQKKEPRNIKDSFPEKVSEYTNYRSQECKLNNGYNPNIINSSID